MLLTFWHRFKVLTLWLIYTTIVFQIARIIMYFYHYDYFSPLNTFQLITILTGGTRFDWISITIAHLPTIFICLIPIPLHKFRRIVQYTFVITFAIYHLFLFLNFVDIPYFSFIHKRSTADLFFQIGGQTDILKQIPAYLQDFWYLFLLFFLLVYTNYKVFQHLFKNKFQENTFSLSKKNTATYILILISVTGITVISIRGGLQRIPLDIIDAGLYTEPSYAALVLNTPFSIIKSVEQKTLPKYDFFNDNENIKTLKQIKQYPFTKMIKKNIVLIILESFSKEYTALGKKQSYTPFLDSLMQHSIVFENAWSNGTKSIEGIPAIISSVPSWMDNPFINSLYCNNTTHALPHLLKKEQYYSAFFHGGINGTMNFDAYAKQAGFDSYFGKNEYPYNDDFDNYWGIWDEPFLQFAAEKISQFPTPFFVSIFTLSSHHPFQVPTPYKQSLPKGPLPIHQTIAYTDMALKEFFQKIQHTTWYKNTLFIFTADHTGISEDPYFSSIAGRYQIPILLFIPDNHAKKTERKIIQQIDILPTILYLLHYPHPFFSFGNNYYDTTLCHYTLFYESGYYYMATDSLLLSFRNFQLDKATRYTNNQLQDVPINAINKSFYEEQIKRIIQNYNNRLIKNDIPSVH